MTMSDGAVLLANAAVVDGLGDEPSAPANVLIQDGRIACLRASKREARESTVIDVRGGYVMAGLWDAHCHLSLMIPDPTSRARFDTEAEASIRAGHNAVDAMRAGFTSLRVVGEVNAIDFAWRAAFRSGLYDGPRIVCAGNMLSSTGGHLRQHRFQPLVLDQLTQPFDGPDDATRATREQLHRGADLIKIAITGGMGPHEGTSDTHVVLDEIAAVCSAAKTKRRPVAAHASGGQITKGAIRLGIDSVEHGYSLDEECIDLMEQHATTLVPTIGVTHGAEFGRRRRWSDEMIAKSDASAEAHRASLQMAHEHRIRICAGGDKYPIADSGICEIELLGQLVLDNRAAIRAATINPAAMCGLDHDLGTVEVGKIADLIVLRSNPLENLSAVRSVELVMSGGRVVVDRMSGDDHHRIGAGVTVNGIPDLPLAPEPAVARCCGE